MIGSIVSLASNFNKVAVALQRQGQLAEAQLAWPTIVSGFNWGRSRRVRWYRRPALPPHPRTSMKTDGPWGGRHKRLRSVSFRIVKSWKALAIAALLLGAATLLFLPWVRRGVRSVRLLGRDAQASTRFDRSESAALFVGVSKFTNGTVDAVPYAVDDAVDLPYEFAMSDRVRLVMPRRILLVLSGQPAKRESKDRLRTLRENGAKIPSRGRSRSRPQRYASRHSTPTMFGWPRTSLRSMSDTPTHCVGLLHSDES